MDVRAIVGRQVSTRRGPGRWPAPAPSSRQRASSSGAICFGARIASGVCACVLTISAGATAFSRQPVQMRSICRAAPLPSLPAQTIAA